MWSEAYCVHGFGPSSSTLNAKTVWPNKTWTDNKKTSTFVKRPIHINTEILKKRLNSPNKKGQRFPSAL